MLFKNTGAIEAFARGCNWLTYVCLPFWLTPEQFGSFSFLLAIVLLVSAMGTAGQDRAILRYVRPDADLEQKQRISVGFLIAPIFSLFVLTMFFLILQMFNMAHLFERALVWVVVWCVLQTFYMLLISLARALSDSTAFLVIRAVYGISKLIFMCLVAAMNMDVALLVITESLLLLAILVFSVIAFYNRSAPPTNKTIWRSSFWFGLPLVFHILAGASLGHLDKLMIANMLDQGSLGIYAFINSIVGGVFFVFAVINIVYEAKVYQIGEGEKAEALMKKMFLISIISAILLLGLTNLALPFVLEWVGKMDYYNQQLVLILSLAYLIYPLYLQSNIRFALREKTKFIPLMTGGAAVVNIGMNLILIPLYGILGAAYSTLGAYIVLVSAAQLTSRKV